MSQQQIDKLHKHSITERELKLLERGNAWCMESAVQKLLTEHDQMQERIKALEHGLRLAAIRLEILTGRARACHEVTGQHELIGEAEIFCQEARQALEEGTA